MAYRNDISALGANHHWDFNGDSLDQIGTVNGTDTSIIYTDTAITEDAVNCATTNAVADRISIPTTVDINNSAQTRKAVAGWFEVTAIQPAPKRIYGEGDNATAFQFVLAYGNNVMFEVVEPTNFDIQVYGGVIVPNRVYHLCGIFEGSGFANEVRFYVDGVKQLDASPVNRQPGTVDLNLRGVAEFGDPVGTVGVGEGIILLQASLNGRYQHWVTFDGANAALTDAQVRQELFEKGALPATTIASGTQAAMQTTLDGLASTVRANAPLCIRVNTVTGDGNLTLSANNVAFDPLASIHIQYMGTGTLTWRNTNGSDASIGSTPNGGTIVIATEQTLTVTALDASDLSVIEGARVYIEADTGGDLVAGTQIVNMLTNVSGVASFTFDYTNDQPIVGRIRKGTTVPRYNASVITGSITSNGLDITNLMVGDE